MFFHFTVLLQILLIYQRSTVLKEMDMMYSSNKYDIYAGTLKLVLLF